MRIIDWSSDVCSSVLAPPWACSISYQRWPSTAKPQVPELSEDTASHPSDTRAQNSRNQPIMRPTIIKPPTSDFPFATGRQHVSLPPSGLAAASKGGDSSSPAAGGPTFGRGTDVLLSLDDKIGRTAGGERVCQNV